MGLSAVVGVCQRNEVSDCIPRARRQGVMYANFEASPMKGIGVLLIDCGTHTKPSEITKPLHDCSLFWLFREWIRGSQNKDDPKMKAIVTSNNNCPC